jgi:hypothetical protein
MLACFNDVAAEARVRLIEHVCREIQKPEPRPYA